MKTSTLCRAAVATLLAGAMTAVALADDQATPRVSAAGGSMNMSVNAQDIDPDDVAMDLEGNLSVRAPLGLTANIEALYQQRVEDLKADGNTIPTWETIREASLSGELWVEFEIGKIDAEFGAGKGIGASQQNRIYDSTMMDASLALRGVTGIKIGGLDKTKSEAANKLLSGLSVVLFNADETGRPNLDAFDSLDGFNVRKVGTIGRADIDYQVSYTGGTSSLGDLDAFSVSAQKCFTAVCLYGEHQNLADSALSDLDSATMVGGSRSFGRINAAIEYTDATAKTGASSERAGRSIGVHANREVGSFVVGAAVVRNRDTKDNLFQLNAHKKFGRK